MLEADFVRYFGLDLRIEAETAGCRRLWVLIGGLPREAATWREDLPGWTQADELAALAIEDNARWMRLMLTSWGAKKHNLPDIPDIRHPDRQGPKEKPKLTTDPAEIQQFFAGAGLK